MDTRCKQEQRIVEATFKVFASSTQCRDKSWYRPFLHLRIKFISDWMSAPHWLILIIFVDVSLSIDRQFLPNKTNFQWVSLEPMNYFIHCTIHCNPLKRFIFSKKALWIEIDRDPGEYNADRFDEDIDFFLFAIETIWWCIVVWVMKSFDLGLIHDWCWCHTVNVFC